MPKPLEVEQALRRGLAYLKAQQQADGGFLSYSSLSAERFKPVETLHTTFVPALTLASLADIDLPEARPIRERLARFLLQQKSPTGAFNYWASDAPERKTMSYPDDLDDTFCALSALALHDPGLISEQVMAQSVKLLLATEVKVGGPYRTWLVPATSKSIWLDTDVAVNANIAFFLSLVDSALPNLEKLLDDTILANDYSSPYYPSPYPFMYYFSRAYHGPHQARLRTTVRRLHRQANLAPLNNSLCITARLRLNDSRGLGPAVSALLRQQAADGAWPPAAFYADRLEESRTYYSGAASLTTAFACEALRAYAQCQPAAPKQRRATPKDQHAPLTSQLLRMAEAGCEQLSPDFRRAIVNSLSKLARGGNGEEITGLPQAFNASLREPSLGISADFLRTLSLANLYGWLAYTIYDDFLDDSGQPRLLPIANVSMRRSLGCFSESLPFHRPFQALLRNAFDTIDNANAWELAHCRFTCADGRITIGELPDYGALNQLAERSLGHTLPLLAILSATGVDDSEADFQHIRQALSHYLIARQLNDDIHDWEEDLAKGHITYVVGQLLEASSATAPGGFSVSELRATVRKQFWHASLPALCRKLRRQVTLAQQALRGVTILTPDNIIAELLAGIEASVADTLAKHKQAQAFLKHYKESV